MEKKDIQLASRGDFEMGAFGSHDSLLMTRLYKIREDAKNRICKLERGGSRRRQVEEMVPHGRGLCWRKLLESEGGSGEHGALTHEGAAGAGR